MNNTHLQRSNSVAPSHQISQVMNTWHFNIKFNECSPECATDDIDELHDEFFWIFYYWWWMLGRNCWIHSERRKNSKIRGSNLWILRILLCLQKIYSLSHKLWICLKDCTRL